MVVLMHQAALPPYIKDTLVIQHEAKRRRAVPRLKFLEVSGKKGEREVEI